MTTLTPAGRTLAARADLFPRLVEWLGNVADHGVGCRAVQVPPEGACDCGYDTLLAAGSDQ